MKTFLERGLNLPQILADSQHEVILLFLIFWEFLSLETAWIFAVGNLMDSYRPGS